MDQPHYVLLGGDPATRGLGATVLGKLFEYRELALGLVGAHHLAEELALAAILLARDPLDLLGYLRGDREPHCDRAIACLARTAKRVLTVYGERDRALGVTMTCYMKHLGWLFAVLDLDKDAGNRHRLDREIKHALGMPEDAPCPDVEAHLHSLSEGEQFDLIDRLEREFAE